MNKIWMFCLFVCGLLCLSNASMSSGSLSNVEISAETSLPHYSTYTLGQRANLFVTARILDPYPTPIISYSITNVWNQVIAHGRLAGSRDGALWRASWSIPTNNLGFFKIEVQVLDKGRIFTLPASGSRPEGEVTYCVVPNPLQRYTSSESTAFFGMQGGFSASTTTLLPLLGVHWVLGNLDWAKNTDAAGRLDKYLLRPELYKSNHTYLVAPLHATFNGTPWPLYPLPTLEVLPPPWLRSMSSAERNRAWSVYTKKAASLFTIIFPKIDRRLYQVTWEPNSHWQFLTDKQGLVDWTKIAYQNIHSVDPKAIIIGPTASDLNERAVKWSCQIISLGIGRYLDGWSIHPYTDSRLPYPERLAQLTHGLGSIKKCLLSDGDNHLGIYSTESGDQSQNNGKGLIAQALYVIDSNVIMKAMGLRMSIAFYIADFPKPPNYGLYYNDIPGLPFGSDQLSPKPVAPAYAVMTYMLGATVPDGSVSGLQKSFYAFRFKGKSRQVIVAWSRDGAGHELSIPPGNYHIYGWMGNPMKSNAKQIKVGQFPVYIVYK